LVELSRRLGALAVAPLFRSAPVSPIAQPDFFNTVVLAASHETPEALLELAKRLEKGAGRVDGPRWGPRPLDVDLLLVGELRRSEAALTLPHPRLRERGFVLAPLAALAPELRLPPDGRTVAELLAKLPPEAMPVRVPWTGG
ncbi:MAG TPA: 2-amino-4-hydroxy-6-hydroxymethyldihydropteridine diphosphokinase, partial [Thermoanaerobaculia bacterium]|nr:2-amino-4-hydroxy-6-hydroxymethyldihydropteridine diphosphokinase [Thermoanaerobaculia bacterium]